jgi:hypothetical protein
VKNRILKIIIYILFISLNSFAQDGKFSFTISSPVSTSAGVFKNDSILVRTLWNNVSYAPGTYTKYWDGRDDYGVSVLSPAPAYKIKIVSNNVQYQWQGTIGNSSDSMTGNSKHRGYYHCMRGLAFSGSFGYFCTGYSEGSPSLAKFNTATPNQKISIYSNTTNTGDINYVAADGTNVYWAGFNSGSVSNTYVFATRVADDHDVVFSGGGTYAISYNKTYSTASQLNVANSLITGLAVQKNGQYLFVARSGLNQLQVLNKTTGTLVQTLTINTVRSISVDGSDNLWMVSGTNTVAKYIVNSDGTLSSATLTLSGLQDPLATQVSKDGSLISVADGSTSQQVKCFNNSTGVVTNTIGSFNGYLADPTVNNNKFYFSDLKGNRLTFIAYETDGSFWVNDPGNFRVQHYSASGSFIERIMSLGANYSVFVDKNNIKKVFGEFLEFDIDYSVQMLTGNSGWVLVKNWGATTPVGPYIGVPRFQTTLSNGRTYGFIRKTNDWEVVEFPATGSLRFTGIVLSGLTKLLCNDGSLQDYTLVNGTATLKRYPLTGFDGIGNPIWSTSGELLANALTDNTIGNPVAPPNSQVFSNGNKVVFFNYKAYANNVGPVFSTGYHLGLMQKGASNAFLFQTEKSTDRNYQGAYPQPGYFDCGNLVNDNAGGTVNIIDKSIFTSYHGEFWKNSQTNKFNHYYENGLAIGQFGITRPETFGPASSMMAGNALTPTIVKDANGDYYVYHGDESDHAALHRWKITGLNTITEQNLTINYPSAYIGPLVNFVNLMKDLPSGGTLVSNIGGWTRNPIVNDETNWYNSLWRVTTAKISYKDGDNDVSVDCLLNTAGTNTVSRDLGINAVNTNWKITGVVSYPNDNTVNTPVTKQFLEVLDAGGKKLISFYVAATGGTTTIYGNDIALGSATGSTIQRNIVGPLSFEVKIEAGVATFTYGNYPPVTAPIVDAAGSWKTPKTLQLRFVNTGASGQNYTQMIAVQNFRFYKDYNITPPVNQLPVANAGADKIVTLPNNSATLTGSGTDADGTISAYTWVKISGPVTGTIAAPAAATTAINNLVVGIYQYELNVTDNSGAIAKDTLQVTVNAAPNVAPTANAGLDNVITLPVNATTLSGTGTDSDGTVSSYGWVKISGPSLGNIVTANAATTTVNNLVQGLYQYELTVTDNNGAIGKDTVMLTVNAAGNQAPVASAGSDKTITLPTNTTTLAGNGTDADGTVSGYVWIKISGPSAGIIATPVAATTVLNNLVLGVYQYELTVTDNNGSIGKDTIQVTVNAAVNRAPIANAGSDKAITLPTNTTTLIGNGTDADGTISGYVWIKISGPSSGIIATPVAATTVLNNLVQGVYQYELTVTDNNGSIGKDTIQVTVNAAVNRAPIANAGSDKAITLPTNTTTLIGNGTDADGTISGYVWIKISGPASYVLTTPNAATTSANSLVQGIYKFELTVTDNAGATGKDTIQVTVNAAVITNQLPTANAGADISITLPTSSIALTGSGTDADGKISSYSWAKISGPASYVLTTPNAATTSANSLVQGIYKFELTVTDNAGATGKDTIQVTVNVAVITNQLPTANAGLDIDMVLPTNIAFLKGTGSDPDGTIMLYNWKVISGPAGYSISTSVLSDTRIENLFQGVYKIEFTVTDNVGATSKDTLTITVSSPRLSGFSSNSFKIYPNPVKDIANLSITSVNLNTKLSIAVIDISGKTVSYKEMVTSGLLTLVKLNLTNLSDGNYVVTVRFDDGRRLSTRIIKYGSL